MARATVALAAAGFVAFAVTVPAAGAADGSDQLLDAQGQLSALLDGQVDPAGPLPPVPTPTVPPAVEDVVSGVVDGVPTAVQGVGNSVGEVLGAVAEAPAVGGSTGSTTAAAPTPSVAAATPTTAAGAAEAALNTARPGEIRPSGSTAVLRFAQSATALLVLLLAAVAFLVTQSSTERRNPRLLAAPIDRQESELEFR